MKQNAGRHFNAFNNRGFFDGRFHGVSAYSRVTDNMLNIAAAFIIQLYEK